MKSQVIEKELSIIPSAPLKTPATNGVFWKADSKGLSIVVHKLNEFLKEQGYRIFWIDKENYITVRKCGGIIQEAHIANISKSVLEYARKQKGIIASYTKTVSNKKKTFNYTADDLVEYLSNTGQWLYSKSKTDLWERLEDRFIKGFPNKILFYFKDQFVAVNSKGISLHDYSELEKFGYIWESQILNREIGKESITAFWVGEFHQFLKCVCTRDKDQLDEDRYKALRSMIGYLLNPYPKGKRYGIILTDEMSSEEEDMGRTGKSLIGQAIKQVTKTTIIQSKTADFKSRFAYQEVQKDDKVVVINDLPKKLKFDLFYNIVSDAVTVEKKNKNPFQVHPKILMTTNSLPSGGGDSVRDRFIELQLTSFFNLNHSPRDYFGHYLFDDWKKKDWKEFDFELFDCARLYLSELEKDTQRREENQPMNYGIIRIQDDSLEGKRLIANSSEEFYKWTLVYRGIDGKPLQSFKEYNRGLLREDFESYRESLIDPRLFTRYLKAFAKYKGWQISKFRPSNGKYYFSFQELK